MLENELQITNLSYNLAVIESNPQITNFIRNNLYPNFLLNTFIDIEEYGKYQQENHVDITFINCINFDIKSLSSLFKKSKLNTTKIIALVNKNHTKKQKLELIKMGFDDFIENEVLEENLIPKLNIWSKQKNNNIIKYKQLIMNFYDISVTFYNKDIKLSVKEFMILKYLMLNAEKIKSREQIIEFVWKKNSLIDERTVDVNINRVRNALKAAHPQHKDIINTVRSMGYCLNIDDSQ